MAIGFPPTPAVGTPHSYAGKDWEWTGNGWKRLTESTSTGSATIPVRGFSWVYQSYDPVLAITSVIPTKQVEYV